MKIKFFIFILIFILILFNCKKESVKEINVYNEKENFETPVIIDNTIKPQIKNNENKLIDTSNDIDYKNSILYQTNGKGKTEILKITEIIKLLK